MMDRQNKKPLASVLRHRVSIQAKEEALDSENEHVETWNTVDSVWASVDPIKAVQQFENRSVGVDATHLIKVRGSTVVTELNQIQFGTRNFEILTIENIQERGVLKVITCKEVR